MASVVSVSYHLTFCTDDVGKYLLHIVGSQFIDIHNHGGGDWLFAENIVAAMKRVRRSLFCLMILWCVRSVVSV